MSLSVIAIIGGSGLLHSTQFKALEQSVVSTPEGDVLVRISRPPAAAAASAADAAEDGKEEAAAPPAGTTLVFVQRHGAEPDVDYRPPHLINYKAIALALDHLNVEACVGFCSVGSMRLSLKPGTLVVPDDYFSYAGLVCIHDDKRAHFVPGFDDLLRRNVLDALYRASLRPQDGGVYVNSSGPRFETKAEIRLMATMGELVGMTGAHEATVLQEMKIPYAMVCMVDNYAHGLADRLTLEAFHGMQEQNKHTVETAVSAVLACLNRTHVPSSAGGSMGDPERQLKRAVDFVVEASYILPVEPDPTTELQDHVVVVHDGIIVDVLPYRAAADSYVAGEVVSLPNHLLCPSLINAHTHAPMCALRGHGSDLPLMEWLTTHIWPLEGKWVSSDFVTDFAELAIGEMLRSGTSCFNDMYFMVEDMAAVVKRTGIRASLAHIIFDFPTAWGSGPDDYFDKAAAIQARAVEEAYPLITWTLAPHAPYTVSDEHWKRVAALSEEWGMPIHTHIHETATECEKSEAGEHEHPFCHNSEAHCRPLKNLRDMGVLAGGRVIAAHMTQLTDEEIEIVKESGTSVVHCPSSNMKLASGFCPVAKLVEAGVNVCIGTDGAASNDNLNMLQELRMTALLAKGVAGRADAVPAAIALQMATLNGARALGIGDRVGSLVAGKEADMVAINLGEIETLPMYSAISHLVYACARENVTNVWVRGRRLLHDRRLTTIDESRMKELAYEWGHKISEGKTKRSKFGVWSG